MDHMIECWNIFFFNLQEYFKMIKCGGTSSAREADAAVQAICDQVCMKLMNLIFYIVPLRCNYRPQETTDSMYWNLCFKILYLNLLNWLDIQPIYCPQVLGFPIVHVSPLYPPPPTQRDNKALYQLYTSTWEGLDIWSLFAGSSVCRPKANTTETYACRGCSSVCLSRGVGRARLCVKPLTWSKQC